MFPHLPWLPWPTTYGVLVAVGFVVGLLAARHLSTRAGLPKGVVEDVIVWACLVGLLGAKLLLILVDPAEFLDAPLGILTQAGVFYGGVVAAVLFVLGRCWRLRISPNALGDACAPALPLAHAFGRLGCFAAGCCWGRACDLPWGVTYGDGASVALQSDPELATVHVHPVQLYESAGNVLIALLAWWVLRHRRFVGQAWWTYVLAYGVVRAGLEELRGDPRGTFLGTRFSTSQGVAAVAVLVAAVMLLWLSRRRQLEPEPSPSAPIASDAGA